MKKRKEKTSKKYVRTTVSLPEEVWRELRVESIDKKITMGDLIAKKIRELKELQKRAGFSSL
ncbi:MAG: chromosome segregation protein SMC [Hydrogenobacter sp.]